MWSSNCWKVSLFYYLFDSLWSKWFMYRNYCSTKCRDCKVCQYPFRTIFTINSHKLPKFTVRLNLLHHTKESNTSSKIIYVFTCLSPSHPSIRSFSFCFIPPTQEICIWLSFWCKSKCRDYSRTIFIQWTCQNMGIFIHPTNKMFRVTRLLCSFNKTCIFYFNWYLVSH